MAQLKVVTRDQARIAGRPAPGCETRAFISGASDPLHLHQHTLDPDARLSIAGTPADRLCYVLDGEVALGALWLDAGSSFVVERAAAATLTAGPAGATLAEFHHAENCRTSTEREGGRVHAMPRATVPRTCDPGRDGAMGDAIGGAFHADAACPTCRVWLHESDFHVAVAGVVPLRPPATDEILFVIAGSIRLGNRTYGARTGIAVAAGTFYAFDVPAGGLSFLTFRVGAASGGIGLDEAAFWTAHAGKPRPIEVTGDIRSRDGAR